LDFPVIGTNLIESHGQKFLVYLPGRHFVPVYQHEMFRNISISNKFQFPPTINQDDPGPTPFKFGAEYVFDSGKNLGGFFESKCPPPEIRFNATPSIINTDKGK